MSETSLHRSSRLTPYGWWQGIKNLWLPLSLILIGFDIIGYLVATYIFQTCYGLLCLL